MRILISKLRNKKRGVAIAEFVLVLPFVTLLILLIFEFGLLGIRSIVVQHAAFRAARVAEVYQKDHASQEVASVLPPVLLRDGMADSFEDRSSVAVTASSRFLSNLFALRPSFLIKRRAPLTFALPQGLSNTILRGGDTPSPYCGEEGEGYRVCGYPE